MKLGFIGLGIMGKPMVNNLLKAGHEVAAYDLVTENVRAAESYGARAKGSVAELAQEVDVIITMLPNSPHVKSVVLDENGILDNAGANTVLIDMSSISPGTSVELCNRLKSVGAEMLDAPVSGGEPKAIDGTLSIMVGGKQEVFDRYKDLLLAMGATAVLCGGIGAGNTTKLANQVIVGANIAAVAEALMLGKKAGVSQEAIWQAVRGGLAGSTVLDAKAPMMIEGSFKPGFRLELHVKDLMNAMEAGQAYNAPLPLSSMVLEMMKELQGEGFGAEDHSALYRYYESMTD